jgi:hypothetical protein
MRLLQTVSKIISERLGVPDNIADVAEVLYDKIINILPNSIDIDDLQQEEFIIPGKYNVGDITIKGFKIGFTYQEYPENTLAGLQHRMVGELSNKMSKTFMIYTKHDDIATIYLNLVGDKSMTGKDVKDIMRDNKNKLISSLAHEIKHYYDNIKNPYESLTTRADYGAKSDVTLGQITPINKLIHYMYYIHNIENLVRPSEIYTYIKMNKINKKQFYDYFTKHNIIETLRTIKNYSYDDLINELKNNIPEIKNSFDINNISYEGYSDQQIIDEVFKLTMIALGNFKGGSIRDMLITSFSEQIFGLSDEKQKFLNKYINNLESEVNNPKNFFKKEIKKMNFMAEKTIKKIAKLYDMIEDPNKNLNEIIRWHDKPPKKTNKIETEFKFKKSTN